VQIFSYTGSLKMIIIFFFSFCERLVVQILWTSYLSGITRKFWVITMFLILELVSRTQCVCVCSFLYDLSLNQAPLAYSQWLIRYHIQTRSWTEYHSATILLFCILPNHHFDKTFTLVLEGTIYYHFSTLK
jgi:hypothetical protein